MKRITEFNWYDLRDNETILLKNNLLNDVISSSIRKMGNLNKVCKETGLSYPSLSNALDGKVNMVSVGKLKKLAKCSGTNYNIFNNKIAEVRKGAVASIFNPKFPIDLTLPEIGAILGNLASDGSFYIDGQCGIRRLSYSTDSKDPDAIERFIKNVTNVFGDVHINKEIINKHPRIKIGSSSISDALEIAGAIIGNKTKVNGRLPWIVRKGKTETKKQYLRSVFSDEGCVAKLPAPYVTYSRYNRLDLSAYEKCIISKTVEPYMKTSIFPTGHIKKEMSFKKFVYIIGSCNTNITGKIVSKIRKSIPKLIKDESNMMKRAFKVHNNIWISSIHKSSGGHYSIKYDIFIKRKESLVRFYRNIGFSSPKKQEKLERFLSESGWI